MSALALAVGLPAGPSVLQASERAIGRATERQWMCELLIAGGAAPDELTHGLARWDEIGRQVPQGCRNARSPQQAAHMLLVWLHESVLKAGYERRATSLATTLDRGAFNCVCESWVLHLAARQFGIQTALVESGQHVWVEVVTPGGRYPLEATSPTGLARTPTRPPDEVARVLDREAAIGLLYYNRGAEALASGDYAAAIALNITALKHDPHRSKAAANLQVALNDWAVLLHSQGHDAEADRLLRLGESFAPEQPVFALNRLLLQGESTSD